MTMMLLVLFTLLATTVAVFSSIVAWRHASDARLRSEARVAALSEAIGAEEAADAPFVRDTAARSSVSHPDHRRQNGGHDRDLAIDRSESSRASNVDSDGSTPHDHMFAQAQGPSSNWRLRPAFAIAAIAGITVLGTLLVASRPERATTVERPAAPLELLALRYAQDGGTTTITGLVRNSAGRGPVERVTVVVFLFDDSGAFLASARAPLDFTRLAGGEESPFHVSLATPQGASRYRVSFRYAEGGIVPHVDRRKD